MNRDLEAIGWYLLINSKQSVCSEVNLPETYILLLPGQDIVFGIFFFKTVICLFIGILNSTIQLIFSDMSVSSCFLKIILVLFLTGYDFSQILLVPHLTTC